MAVPFNVKTKRNVINGKNEIKYYAVPKAASKVSLEDIAKDISKSGSLSPGDVYAALIGLSESILFHLSKGNRITIDGLGTFSLSITSMGADTKEQITAHKVKVSKVCFTPALTLKRQLRNVKFTLNKQR